MEEIPLRPLPRQSQSPSKLPAPTTGKQLSNPASTGNAGGTYEHRVQAVYLLAMLTGGATAVGKHSSIVELRFQAAIHGYKTDDLVCTLQDDVGQPHRALLQVKRHVGAIASDVDFTDSCVAAWLDYQNPACFTPGRDRIFLVHETTSGESIAALKQLIDFARGSSSQVDFLHKALAERFSSGAKRAALQLARGTLDGAAGRTVTDLEFWQFLSHWGVLQHSLQSRNSPEAAQQQALIQAVLGKAVASDPSGIWDQLVGACGQFNMSADTVSLSTLKDHLSARELRGFATHRAADRLPTGPVPASHLLTSDSSAPIPARGVAGLPLTSTAQAPATDIGLPAALPASINRFVSGQLDGINERIKAGQFQDALKDLQSVGADHSVLDEHQRSRWYLMRGACHWATGHTDEAAADYFRAADLYPDDDKMAAGRVRGHALMQELPAALRAAESALQRFPDSMYVWTSWALAKVLSHEPIRLEDFPVSRRADADVLQLVAWSKRGQKDWHAAIEFALKAISANDATFTARNAALAIVLEAVTESPLAATFRVMEERSVEALRAVVTAFEPRSERLWALQSRDSLTRAATHLAISNLLLQDATVALRIVEEAKAHGVVTSDLVRVELEALSESRPLEEFRARARQAMGLLAEDGLVTLAQAASNRADIELVEHAIEASKVLVALSPRAADSLLAIRWTALWNTGRQDDAVAAVEAAEIDKSDSLPLLVAGTRLLLKVINDKRLSRLLHRARALVDASDRSDERLLLADLLVDAKHYGQAAELFKRALPSGLHSEMHNRWLYALLKAGNRRGAKELLEHFPATWIHDERARSLAMDLGNQAGDIALLTAVANAEFDRSPEKAASWIFRHTLDLQTMSLVELRGRLSAAPLNLEGSIRELTQLAAEELRLGLEREGLRRLYRMRRLNEADIESASSLFIAISTGRDQLPDMEDALDVVRPGSHVSLVDEGGVRVQVTIEPPEVGELPPTAEFKPSTSAEAIRLIGAATGAEILVPQSFGSTRSYRIVAVKSAFRRVVELAVEAMHQSVAPIPHVSLMQMSRATDGTPDFSEMLEQLKQKSARVRQCLDAYRSGSVTLGVLALMLGRDTIELVRGWGNAGLGVKLQTCLGTPDERSAALQLLASTDAGYVVDAATLAEVALLNMGDVLTALPKLYVSRETEAAVMRALEQSKRERSSGQAFERDGKLGFNEFTPEQQARDTAQLQHIADLMHQHCEVVPVYGPEKLPEDVDRLVKILPDEDRQVLLLAAEKGLRVFSVDFRLRNIASLAGLQGVWPQVVLMHAVATGVITGDRYSRAVAHMFIGSRSFVSLGAPELAFICHQGTAWLRFGMAKFMEHLRDPEADYGSAVSISRDLAEFLLYNTCTYMGALAELLKHMIESLMRHPAADGKLPRPLVEFFAGISLWDSNHWGYKPVADLAREQDAVYKWYFADAIRTGAKWAEGAFEKREIRINVLMCGVTPWLALDNDKDDMPALETLTQPRQADA